MNQKVRALYRKRERSFFLRVSVGALAVLVLFAWCSDALALGDLLQQRRFDGFVRFVTEDIVPPSLRDSFSLQSAWSWFASWWGERGWPAIATTVPIAVFAIVLAALCSVPGAVLGSRPGSGVEACGHAASVVARLRAFLFRSLAILARAIPEYVLAFCLLALLGQSALPAVLALAIHNGGILSRLGADSIEDLDVRPLRALRATGAGESRVLLAGVLPGVFPRFLLYFFYRFETCMRESTALGLLGIVSLGYFVEEARAHQQYDELVLLMLLAAVLFGGADLLSVRCRRWLESEN